MSRSAFSTNLLEMISLEHANTVAASSRPPGRREKADWKFAQVGTMAELLVKESSLTYSVSLFQLDQDGDGALSKRESRQLRGAVRRLVRPRRCGRSFLRYCDQVISNTHS